MPRVHPLKPILVVEIFNCCDNIHDDACRKMQVTNYVQFLSTLRLKKHYNSQCCYDHCGALTSPDSSGCGPASRRNVSLHDGHPYMGFTWVIAKSYKSILHAMYSIGCPDQEDPVLVRAFVNLDQSDLFLPTISSASNSR
jgi:hypothetical protein